MTLHGTPHPIHEQPGHDCGHTCAQGWSVRFLVVTALIVLAAATTTAQVREWNLSNPNLVERTTALLVRYYSVTRPDSVRLRYIRSWSESIPFRLRGRLAGPDSVAAILSISLGQLTIFPTDNIRIAVGEDLYSELLASGSNTVSGGIEFLDVEDWSSRTASISLERIEMAATPDIRGLVAFGAPESHLPWWTDGTLRFGVAGNEWEFSALVPLAAGATSIGPLRERRLLPSYGASGRIRAGHFDLWARTTRRLDFDPADSGRFYHSVGGGGSYGAAIASRHGILQARFGIQIEEFKPMTLDSIRPASDDVIRRFSPTLHVTWGDFSGIARVSAAWEDYSLAVATSIRLTTTLWIDLRCVAIDLLREPESFEHPFYLFLTPRIIIP